jgi:hypothetical protein
VNDSLTCPECGEDVWDGPSGSKLAKCWNGAGHMSGAPLAFDTMDDEDEPTLLTGEDAARAIRQGYPHPVAYAYEASEHCPRCTALRFGVDRATGFVPEAARDSEGNPIGATAPWSETDDLYGTTCDTCGDVIHEGAVHKARAAGYDAGKAAGSWIVDGNTSTETARALLAGIEDGDPAVLDQLPTSPLSGEWADAPTPRDVLEDVNMTEDDEGAEDVLSAYEEGFSSGAEDEAVRLARAILPDDEETQKCRDCGREFPYSEDADYCPACVAEMHPDLHTAALAVTCYDCGADAGRECKPEYGCDDASRAAGHRVKHDMIPPGMLDPRD